MTLKTTSRTEPQTLIAYLRRSSSEEIVSDHPRKTLEKITKGAAKLLKENPSEQKNGQKDFKEWLIFRKIPENQIPSWQKYFSTLIHPKPAVFTFCFGCENDEETWMELKAQLQHDSTTYIHLRFGKQNLRLSAKILGRYVEREMMPPLEKMFLKKIFINVNQYEKEIERFETSGFERELLVESSGYFQALLTQEFSESRNDQIKIREFSKSDFKQLLHYLTNEKEEIQEKDFIWCCHMIDYFFFDCFKDNRFYSPLMKFLKKDPKKTVERCNGILPHIQFSVVRDLIEKILKSEEDKQKEIKENQRTLGLHLKGNLTQAPLTKFFNPPPKRGPDENQVLPDSKKIKEETDGKGVLPPLD